MAEELSLSDVLNAPETESDQEVETNESEVKEEAEEVIESTEEPEGVKEEVVPPTTKKDNPYVPKQAVLDARQKAKELEGKLTTSESEKAALKAELEEAKKKLSSVNTEIKKEEAKAPDMFEDPEGYAKYQRDQVSSETLTLRIELSQDMMRLVRDDYDEMEKVFIEKCWAEDPSLGPRMGASKNPGKFAYDKAKEYLERQDYETNKTSYTEWKKAQDALNKEEAQEQEEVESPKEKAKKSIRKVPDLLNATSAKSGVGDKEDLKSILGK